MNPVINSLKFIFIDILGDFLIGSLGLVWLENLFFLRRHFDVFNAVISIKYIYLEP